MSNPDTEVRLIVLDAVGSHDLYIFLSQTHIKDGTSPCAANSKSFSIVFDAFGVSVKSVGNVRRKFHHFRVHKGWSRGRVEFSKWILYHTLHSKIYSDSINCVNVMGVGRCGQI